MLNFCPEVTQSVSKARRERDHDAIDTELQCVQCANRHAMTAIYRPTTAVTALYARTRVVCRSSSGPGAGTPALVTWISHVM